MTQTVSRRVTIVLAAATLVTVVVGAKVTLAALNAPSKKECRQLAQLCRKDRTEQKTLTTMLSRFGMTFDEPQTCTLFQEACTGSTQCTLVSGTLQCATCGDGVCENAEECTQDCSANACPTDVLTCSDGSVLTRNPADCQFPVCPTAGDPLPFKECPPYSNDPPPANCKYDWHKDENGCDIREMTCWSEPTPEVVCPPLVNDPIPANCRYDLTKDVNGCDVNELVCWSEPRPPVRECPPLVNDPIPANCRYDLTKDENGCDVNELVCWSEPTPAIGPVSKIPMPCPMMVLAVPPAGCHYESEQDEAGCSVPKLVCTLAQACPMYSLESEPEGCKYVWNLNEAGCNIPMLVCE